MSCSAVRDNAGGCDLLRNKRHNIYVFFSPTCLGSKQSWWPIRGFLIFRRFFGASLKGLVVPMVQHEQITISLISLMLTLMGSWKEMKTKMVSEGGTNTKLRQCGQEPKALLHCISFISSVFLKKEKLLRRQAKKPTKKQTEKERSSKPACYWLDGLCRTSCLSSWPRPCLPSLLKH